MLRWGIMPHSSMILPSYAKSRPAGQMSGEAAVCL